MGVDHRRDKALGLMKEICQRHQGINRPDHLDGRYNELGLDNLPVSEKLRKFIYYNFESHSESDIHVKAFSQAYDTLVRENPAMATDALVLLTKLHEMVPIYWSHLNKNLIMRTLKEKWVDMIRTLKLEKPDQAASFISLMAGTGIFLNEIGDAGAKEGWDIIDRVVDPYIDFRLTTCLYNYIGYHSHHYGEKIPPSKGEEDEKQARITRKFLELGDKLLGENKDIYAMMAARFALRKKSNATEDQKSKAMNLWRLAGMKCAETDSFQALCQIDHVMRSSDNDEYHLLQISIPILMESLKTESTKRPSFVHLKMLHAALVTGVINKTHDLATRSKAAEYVSLWINRDQYFHYTDIEIRMDACERAVKLLSDVPDYPLHQFLALAWELTYDGVFNNFDYQRSYCEDWGRQQCDRILKDSLMAKSTVGELARRKLAVLDSATATTALSSPTPP